MTSPALRIGKPMNEKANTQQRVDGGNAGTCAPEKTKGSVHSLPSWSMNEWMNEWQLCVSEHDEPGSALGCGAMIRTRLSKSGYERSIKGAVTRYRVGRQGTADFLVTMLKILPSPLPKRYTSMLPPKSFTSWNCCCLCVSQVLMWFSFALHRSKPIQKKKTRRRRML